MISLWNSNLESMEYFFLGGISIFLHAYAIFLCYAIIDYYHVEKPIQDESPFDVLVKDLFQSEHYFLYYMALVQHISLFTPPISDSSNILYFASHLGVVLAHYFHASLFVTLYVKYIFIFQHKDVEDVQVTNLEWKTFAWKVVITLLAICFSSVLPLEDQPLWFTMLTKKNNYNR